jgi:hypothetical protein
MTKKKRYLDSRGNSARIAIPKNRDLVKVNLCTDRVYPITYSKTGGYIGVSVYSPDEQLVFLIAHELRHAWQMKHTRGRYWRSGKKGISERDADCYGLTKLREYRRRVNANALEASEVSAFLNVDDLPIDRVFVDVELVTVVRGRFA